MKKKRKFLSAGSVILLSASALLLVGSTVGSTRAALTYYSDNYTADMSVSSIGVSLTENGKTISSRDYSHGDNQWDETKGELFKDLQGDTTVVPGKAYEEKLSVLNSGSIDSYVRVILTKSWTDKKGNKDTTLSPDLIKLNFLEDNGWIVDEKSSTTERTVLYYTGIVPAGKSTPNFTDTLKIDNKIAEKVKVETGKDENGNEVIRHVYKYDGYQFHVDAEVNAVQTHNAQDAIKSAWGVDVTVSENGILSLQ
ncbi:hypothetical protein [Blautia sp. Marseille-P3201T]|uniref:hypothetical protein n=1 Tax=Blautia sp. Marseille-P3201T TaxID=1907659 RepID=UPI00093196F8|nr:hypothetical protein [Blautia sp. Marseille-P3201T]